jgi:tetratricopeptide (TPR) repeat protein
MKRISTVLALLAIAALFAGAQGSSTPTSQVATPAVTPSPAAAATSAAALGPTEGKHYLVTSTLGAERSAKLLVRLEDLFSLFARVFRFDEGHLQGKLIVREFGTKADFDAYLLKSAGETRGDFVYIHYPSALKRELLLFSKPEPEFSASLAHQAFVQYLKAFIQDPPLWLRDGFAVCFETVRWKEAGAESSFAENLAWLETVKALKAKNTLIKLDRLFEASPEDARAAVEVFYPEAWAFVSFLVNDTEGDYSRLLWETIATLGPASSLADNQGAFARRVGTWYGLDALEKAFGEYVDSRKTYPELVALGTEQYNKKEYDRAGTSFAEAQRLDPNAFVVPYYLGLIAYSKAQYQQADAFYKQALALGCDKPTANYALGLNSIARGLNDEGASFLSLAATANPDRYRARVDDILKRLGKN